MMASKFAYVSKLLKVVKEKFRRPNLFNDKLCFPPITDCPTEYSSDPDWFWALADKNYRNKRHWCLIAEITGVEMHHYVHLQLRDRDGNDTFVKLIPSPDPKKDREIFLLGHTVAILYAERYGFNDSSVGVRVEDRGNIMVIPATLETILKLGKKFHPHTMNKKANSKAKCSVCGRKGGVLIVCHRVCKVQLYCSKYCETKDWEKRGHKDECCAMHSVKIMSTIEWADFDALRRFPFLDLVKHD